MTRNDGGIHRGDLTRPAVATEDQTALNGGDYWTRTASTEKQPNNYQFTGEKPGDNAAKVAATQAKTDAPGTYTVKDKDSLWSIASRMVRDSSHPDKSDKFKLDVVKGLVEKNKGSIKGLEANPDKIRDGQVLKTDDVRELAKLGHGKVLNTHYKPKEKADSEPSTNETNRKEKIAGKPIDRRTPQYDTAGLGDQRYGDQRFSDPRLSDQRFGDQQFRQQRPLDLGPMKDIIGMIGMFAGGAMRDRFDDRRHWNHHHGPRGYYDGYSQNYYDGGNYGFGQQHPYRHHQQFRQFQEPMEYSHYGRPQHNFNHPMHRSNEFRVQQLESQYRNQQQQQQFQQQLVLQQRENRIQQQQIQQLQREQQQRDQQWQRNPHQRHQHQFRTQA